MSQTNSLTSSLESNLGQIQALLRQQPISEELYNMIQWACEELHRFKVKCDTALTEKESALRTRKEILDNISHELRTPLTTISGNAQLLYDMFDSFQKAEAQELLQLIIDQAGHELALIDDLLTLNTLDANQREVQVEVAELKQMIQVLERYFTHIANRSAVNLRFEYHPETCHIYIDRNGFQTVMTNLLSNAIKFTPPGGSVTVHVQLKANTLCIDVTDTGIGIAPEHLDLIFERFYQVDMSRSRQYDGTGLGLSIVKKMVELMGGFLSVQSTPQHGSTFHVGLPVLSVEPVTEATTSESEM
ncbi:MAG: sensor histidine kinase [Gemmatimonadetes bacterium]|nr:MAG: sensor histidine kinase [Gemmatimonadota bacterium]